MADESGQYKFQLRLNLAQREDRQVYEILQQQKNKSSFIRQAILKSKADTSTSSAEKEIQAEMIKQIVKETMQEMLQERSSEEKPSYKDYF